MKGLGRRWERILRGLFWLIFGCDFPPKLVRRVQYAFEYRVCHGVGNVPGQARSRPRNDLRRVLEHLVHDGLDVSISEATIVANSKTLTHILPHLIPPIDRQYTIRFFTQAASKFLSDNGKPRMIALPKEREKQFLEFKEICVRIKALFDRCDKSLFRIDKNSFNTSYPKIMDNLIVTYVKEKIMEYKKHHSRKSV